MTDETPTRYTVYETKTGDSSAHNSPASAAKAFFTAAAHHRPCVIRRKGRCAGTIARTMQLGDEFVKALPFENDPDFTEAYLGLG